MHKHLFSFAVILIADQLLKYIVRTQNWYYVINPGISLSLGSNWQWTEWLVLAAFLALIIFNRKKTLPLYLILIGGASNLIDRLFFGGVIDYVKIWLFPVFNLADVVITIGVLLITIPNIKNICTRRMNLRVFKFTKSKRVSSPTN